MSSSTQTVRILRHEGVRQTSAHDQVICEHPIAMVFNGLSHAVMMATPSDLEDFGMGFALSEGIIQQASDCLDIEVRSHPHGTELHMQITARHFAALQTQRRTLVGRTGCGLCGIDSLDALQARQPSSMHNRTTHHQNLNAHSSHGTRLPAHTVWTAFSQLGAHQSLQADTGGCHAAAWACAAGLLQCVREDVGRHNALDKLIGHLARTRQLGQPGLALVSSRASYELVSKCARVNIHTLAAISAPTSLAIELAHESGVQLYGFCRGQTAVDYTSTAQAEDTRM